MTVYIERIDPELGVVRLCRPCGEEWPCDEEFFYPLANGRLEGTCRACRREYRMRRREKYREASARYRARKREEAA